MIGAYQSSGISDEWVWALSIHGKTGGSVRRSWQEESCMPPADVVSTDRFLVERVSRSTRLFVLAILPARVSGIQNIQ